MVRSVAMIIRICFLLICCSSQTDYSPQDYVLEDDYGYIDWQNLRFGGAYDEDKEWKVYEESSGKLFCIHYNRLLEFKRI